MKKRLQVKFMFVSAAPPPSDSESESDGESVSDVLSGLKAQMQQIDVMAKSLDTHVLDLYRRAKTETVDWMNEPVKPRRHIQKWCAVHGLGLRPTIAEFTDAVLEAAWSLDLESRILTFKKEDAAILWNGQRRLTVFDMIARVPTLFE
jgi:hypothetical protein